MYEHKRYDFCRDCNYLLGSMGNYAYSFIFSIFGLGGKMDENNEIGEKTVRKYEFWAEILMFLAIVLVLIARRFS